MRLEGLRVMGHRYMVLQQLLRLFWKVDTSSSVNNPFIVCNFDCVAYIGIDPVGMEIFSKTKSCSLWFTSYDRQGHSDWD